MDRTGVVTVKGFATIDNVALINVEGTGMVGVQVRCHILRADEGMSGMVHDCSLAVLMLPEQQPGDAHAGTAGSITRDECDGSVSTRS